MASWFAPVPAVAARFSQLVVPRAGTACRFEVPDPAGSDDAGRCRFSAEFRLRKTDEYSSVFAFRRAIRGRYFTLHVRPSDLGTARLGLVVAKKLARRAAQRNMIKRLARESFRLRRATMPHFDVVLRLTGSPRDATRKALRDELEHLFGKVRG